MKKIIALTLLLLFIACSKEQTTQPTPENTQPTPEQVTTQPTETITQEQTNTQTTQTTQETTEKGKLYLGIKDKAIGISEIKSIKLSISAIHLVNQKEEIIEIPAENEEFDLIDLKNSGITELLASEEIPTGTYKELRLFVREVSVNKGGEENKAKLPSNALKLKGDIIIEKDKTTTTITDFLADKSLHVTGQGRIIFAPVIKYEVQTDTTAQINGKQLLTGTGIPRISKLVGMNTNGDIEDNGAIDPNAPLNWDGNKLSIGEIAIEQKRLTGNANQQKTIDESDFATQSGSGRRFTQQSQKSPQCLETISRCKESCMGSACKLCDSKC